MRKLLLLAALSIATSFNAGCQSGGGSWDEFGAWSSDVCMRIICPTYQLGQNRSEACPAACDDPCAGIAGGITGAYVTGPVESGITIGQPACNSCQSIPGTSTPYYGIPGNRQPAATMPAPSLTPGPETYAPTR